MGCETWNIRFFLINYYDALHIKHLIQTTGDQTIGSETGNKIDWAMISLPLSPCDKPTPIHLGQICQNC